MGGATFPGKCLMGSGILCVVPEKNVWAKLQIWEFSLELPHLPWPCPLPEVRTPVPSRFPHQVYNADGEFLFKFGSHGEGNGQFNAPTGVAVDSNGNIIVADWGNSRIQVSRAQS